MSLAGLPFQAHGLAWATDGSAMLLSGKTAFCLAYPSEERFDESRLLDCGESEDMY